MASTGLNLVRKYSERKIIGYTREQLFDVVAKVEDYHEFVPACKKSVVLQRSPNFLIAKLEIGLPYINESYTSRVCLDRPNIITANCYDGRLFEHLDTRWNFKLAPRKALQTTHCLLEFAVDFQFKSLLYSKLAYLVFDEMAKLNVNAFLKRAEQLYGPQQSLKLALGKS